MREQYELMKQEIENVKDLCAANMGLSAFMDMSADDFKLLQSGLRLVDISMKFTEAQVASMERIEEKLDELLAKE